MTNSSSLVNSLDNHVKPCYALRMSIRFDFATYVTGQLPDDIPCLCMRCPECRGYVMDTREPINPHGRIGDWRPNHRDLIEQAKAMEVEANEGRPATLRRDMEPPSPVGRPRKSGKPPRTKKQTALDNINERIAKTEAKLLRLKAEREEIV